MNMEAESIGMIDGLKRLVSESREKKFLVEDLQNEFSSLGPDSVLKHHNLKLQYNELKKQLREEQFKLFLFEAYDANTQEKDVVCPVSDKDIQDVVKTLREFKSRLNDSKSRIEDLAEDLEISIQQFKDSTNKLDGRLKEFEKKKQVFEDALQMYSAEDNAHDNKEGITSAEASELQSLLNTTTAETGELQTLVCRAQTLLEEYQRQIHEAKADWQLSDWCDGCFEVLQSTVNIVDRGFTSEGWTVDICGPGGPNTEPHLTVNIGITWNGYGKPCISHIKISSEDFPSSDIVGEAMDRNNIAYLLRELQDTWLSMYPLLTEIHDLRQRFAVDWNHESRCFLVMFTESTMCELTVEPGYPEHGNVVLESVSNNTPDNFTMDKSSASLTEWIDHLNHHLSPPKGSKQ